MATLTYTTGDIFDVPADKKVVIAHIVNDVGAFGAGFAQAVANKWPHVRTHYYANFSWYHLGDVLFRDAEQDGRIVVANLFAQDDLLGKENPTPIKYIALDLALIELAETILEGSEEFEVWMPRIGTGYARGQWSIIEPMIKHRLVERGIDVVVFDLPPSA